MQTRPSALCCATLAIYALLLSTAFGQDRISVKEFGAKGDGVADDTAAIQSGLSTLCRDNYTIAAVTGSGISPIIITTATPHTFFNGSTLTVASVTGNTNANGRWSASVRSATTVALYEPAGEASIGNGSYASGGTITVATPQLYFPAGTYNISSPLVTGCATSLAGDGPTASIIFQTHQYRSTHGIIANYPLAIEDMAVNTTQLTDDYGMIAVFAGTSLKAAPMLDYRYSFVRFHSSGFNFGLNINGTSETDLLASIMVRDCNIAVGTKENAVSQPINAANAVLLTVENSTLIGDSLPDGAIRNDHAIYTLAVRGLRIENNLIRNQGNSAIKLLQGGFHDSACPTNQNYTSWTIQNNRIEGSRLAIAVYSYCGLILPSVVIANNLISNIPNEYLGDYAAVYVQSNCQSNILNVLSSGNTFTNIGLGGIVLASQVQSDQTCATPTARGTISNFTSTGDTFERWSRTSRGTFPAINSTGENLLCATVSRLTTNNTDGSLALNLSAFSQVSVVQ